MQGVNNRDAREAKQIDTLWTILDTLLQTGREQIASSAFRLLMAYIFFDNFEKNNANGSFSSKILQAVQDTRIEQSWGSIMMTYRCGQYELSRKCFEYSIKKYSRYLIEIYHPKENQQTPG